MSGTEKASPIERAVRRVDAYQQSHRPLAFTFGVVKKFGDDRGGSLAALIAYYGFLALFPLLLLLTTVLGFVMDRNSSLKASVLSSALRDFPIIGTQLGQAIHPAPGPDAGPRVRDRRPDLGLAGGDPGLPARHGRGVERPRRRPSAVRHPPGAGPGVPRPARLRPRGHDRPGCGGRPRPRGARRRRWPDRVDPAQHRPVRGDLPDPHRHGMCPRARSCRAPCSAGSGGRHSRWSAATSWPTSCATPPRCTATSARSSGWCRGSSSAPSSPCTPRRSTWCGPGGCGPGASCSRP